MKLSIIGAGTIGATLAYQCAEKNLFDELVLVDIAEGLAKGQCLDICHALAYGGETEISCGTYLDMCDSDIIVISAGKPRRPGTDRLDLIRDNCKIIEQISSEIVKNAPDSIVVAVTNPVDIMNRAAFLKTGFDRSRIIGFGGQLDSARFRYLLSLEYSVPVGDVEAYVIGEHGEAQVPVFSRIKIRGELVTIDDQRRDELRTRLRASAMEVIEKKGATVFAPINTLIPMLESIIYDKKETMMCSANLDGEYGLRDVSIGVPTTLGKLGIEKIKEWDLDEYEKKLLVSGAQKLLSYCRSI